MPGYDLLIKGGRVIDAANGVDGVMDVAVAGRGVAAVETDIPDDLRVHVVPSQLLQVLFNLIINARQAMLERGGHLKITAQQDRQQNTIIQVSDTGYGIEPDMIETIFDPFVSTKTDAAQPDRQGTGLGLMVCRDIIEAHAGQLTVQSQPDRGATFTIQLPQTPPDNTGV